MRCPLCHEIYPDDRVCTECRAWCAWLMNKMRWVIMNIHPAYPWLVGFPSREFQT